MKLLRAFKAWIDRRLTEWVAEERELTGRDEVELH